MPMGELLRTRPWIHTPRYCSCSPLNCPLLNSQSRGGLRKSRGKLLFPKRKHPISKDFGPKVTCHGVGKLLWPGKLPPALAQLSATIVGNLRTTGMKNLRLSLQPKPRADRLKIGNTPSPDKL